MKIIHCESCGVKVVEIKSGSKLKAGCVMLCGNCESWRRTQGSQKNKTQNLEHIDKFFDRLLRRK